MPYWPYSKIIKDNISVLKADQSHKTNMQAFYITNWWSMHKCIPNIHLFVHSLLRHLCSTLTKTPMKHYHIMVILLTMVDSALILSDISSFPKLSWYLGYVQITHTTLPSLYLRTCKIGNIIIYNYFRNKNLFNVRVV